MRKFKNPIKNYSYLIYRWVNPIIDPLKLIQAIPRYFGYFRDLIRYAMLQKSEKICLLNTYPCIHDKTSTTSFDIHYFYQDIWAFKKIYKSKVDAHIDIGSRIDFVGFLTAITKVTFVDIRPLKATLENFYSKKGNILSLPFESNSVNSISCLHVAKHIGLGRYGDSLDPAGTEKACKELTRVLAPGGNLYFSLPIGKPRLCFNAHRIHSPKQILEYFDKLKLVSFSGIDDKGDFREDIDYETLSRSDYGCGLFLFTKGS